ncbi:TPA: DUF1461 domain-containing protein [Candidatus Woesearchaeota archaeon]|nr:DUF1461 domain-containing protein [Candidatus Woesearchaeota archaeon]HII68387.1 DUF1461 domain-containing protein [Candidatus Woesearchaeota archaeon]
MKASIATAAKIALIIAIPLIIMLSSAGLVVFDAALHQELMEKHGVYASLAGYDVDMLSEEVVKYLKGERDELASLSFFNERELSHWEDVRTLADKGRMAFAIILALAAVSISAIGFVGIKNGRKVMRSLSEACALGGGILLLVEVILGLIFLLSFDAAFLQFHHLFFPQGNFLFNPAVDKIVVLYPQEFFADCSLAMARNCVAGSALFILCGLVMAHWLPKKIP